MGHALEKWIRYVGWSFLVLFATVAAGCVSSGLRVTSNHKDPDVMHLSVVSLVPAGTSLEDANALMENEGFECEVTRNGTFREMRHLFDKGPDHEGLDFLRCRRTNSNAGFLMGRVWNVAIVLDGDVTNGDVIVSHFVDGP
ncbi:hypothetical protein K227x_17020 [Rubripirellula lacrimiformis]|uniref:Lipoprotein n=1 Tax=Rubripirellula lacrimiformis TaxID=1930273 RepID=A0A517N873_9BACT|nr:hypothetical protein [Rubripirellula lacrimiformis]QDT03320.1 hypothetical protein K227x_17020 [Rubripirellula lacrimiformis]